MKKIFGMILILSFFLSLGCTTINKSYLKNEELKPTECYLGGKFDRFLHTLTFENLETGKRLKLSLKGGNQATIAPIPAGEYALVVLYGQGTNSSYKIDIPHALMKKISVKPGRIVYIGDFTYTQAMFSNIGGVNHSYNLENIKNEISRKYKFDFPIKIVSLEEM